jgi:phage internal scaffolding protein
MECVIKKVRVSKRYNYVRPKGIEFTGAEGVSKAQQHFKDECDINNIMGKYITTGILGNPDKVNALKPRYGDFTNVVSYDHALNQLNAANEQFEGLPSKIRNRFNNNVGQLLAFLDNENNRAEAVELGIIAASVNKEDLKQKVPGAEDTSIK